MRSTCWVARPCCSTPRWNSPTCHGDRRRQAGLRRSRVEQAVRIEQVPGVLDGQVHGVRGRVLQIPLVREHRGICQARSQPGHYSGDDQAHRHQEDQCQYEDGPGLVSVWVIAWGRAYGTSEIKACSWCAAAPMARAFREVRPGTWDDPKLFVARITRVRSRVRWCPSPGYCRSRTRWLTRSAGRGWPSSPAARRHPYWSLHCGSTGSCWQGSR